MKKLEPILSVSIGDYLEESLILDLKHDSVKLKFIPTLIQFSYLANQKLFISALLSQTMAS